MIFVVQLDRCLKNKMYSVNGDAVAVCITRKLGYMISRVSYNLEKNSMPYYQWHLCLTALSCFRSCKSSLFPTALATHPSLCELGSPSTQRSNPTRCPSISLLSSQFLHFSHIHCLKELLFRCLLSLAQYSNCLFTTFLPFRLACPPLLMSNHKGTLGMFITWPAWQWGEAWGHFFLFPIVPDSMTIFRVCHGCKTWEALMSNPLSALQLKWSLKEKI